VSAATETNQKVCFSVSLYLPHLQCIALNALTIAARKYECMNCCKVTIETVIVKRAAAGGGDFLGDLSRAVPMDEGQGADNASSRATEMHPSADSTQTGGPRPDGAEGNAANDAGQEHWEEYGQQEASAAIGEETVVEYSVGSLITPYSDNVHAGSAELCFKDHRPS
jgi:hypothetical protein